MNFHYWLPLGSALVCATLLHHSAAAQGQKPVSLEERVSYAYGVSFAKDLMDRGTQIDKAKFFDAFSSIVDGKESLMTKEEIEDALFEYNILMDEKNAVGDEKVNLENGKKFLLENSQKPGLNVTKRGLQFEVLKQGTGPRPTVDNTVEIHYHGMLIDGTVVDSSITRGAPITLPLGQVMPFWIEGLQYMPVGSKHRLYIPYYLAYGDSSPGENIKPYSALIFEVELLAIK